MKNLPLRSLAALMLLVASAAAALASGRFKAAEGSFMLDGQPFIIKAAELHYPRIPQPYWEHRIKMCKALGMNTVCLYVFWNIHEQEPGVFDFEGPNDVAQFIRLCRDNGMYVILRPGPYVCAEWEMGGLPWWLLKDKDIRLRESDPRFLERVEKFQQALATQVAGLTIDNGGPIIMVQVENEYGSYGIDKEYIGKIRDMLRRNYGDVALFQCDWSSNFLNNGLDDLIWTMNFGTGANIDEQFAALKAVCPGSPLMCSEFWSGWFDKWGANHETRPTDDMVAGIDEMLSKGISFSLYMTHGGTNRGHWAGANSPGYSPDVTSYDYDAPVSEAGEATPKYHALRSLLAGYSVDSLPAIPEMPQRTAIAPFRLSRVAPLAGSLPQPLADKAPRTMEEYGQGFGSILYRTELPAIAAGTVLTVDEAHDYAQIFVDGEYTGTLDRRNAERELVLPAAAAGASLDILVEATGRINFGRAIKDFKGITGIVALCNGDNSRELTGWSVFCLPDSMEFYNAMSYVSTDSVSRDKQGRYPRGAYRGTFTVGHPGDTFLSMENWGKGLVYVNGYALGRFWEIGPQQTIYLPGCWLREGENEILIFDIAGPRELTCEGLVIPVNDKVVSPSAAVRNHISVDALTPIHSASFASGNGWQTVKLPTPASGRFFALEAVDAVDGGEAAAIAEIYLLDSEGRRLSREAWRVADADSEDSTGNHTADKTFDLQESTYWMTAPGAAYPHRIVIDLGGERTVGGLEYLPRMEPGAPAAIATARLYIF